jgi:hypothetical protein
MTPHTEEKMKTINELLIAAIAYRNPNNTLIENIQTLTEIWTALHKRKKEAIEKITNNKY